ncbi:MAG: hypothetical protein ACI9ZH_001815 [Paracoccaceae bacterium]|jgi:hypothetical protein
MTGDKNDPLAHFGPNQGLRLDGERRQADFCCKDLFGVSEGVGTLSLEERIARMIRVGTALADYDFDELFDVNESAPGLTSEQKITRLFWDGAGKDARGHSTAAALRAQATDFEAECNDFDVRPHDLRAEAKQTEDRVKSDQKKRNGSLKSMCKNLPKVIAKAEAAREAILKAAEKLG